MKKLFSLIILSVLSLSMMAQAVEKTYRFEEPKIVELRGYQQITFNGCMQTAIAGNPSLPYYSVSLLLPQGMEAESIEVELSDFQDIEGIVNLFPYQPSRTMNDKEERDLIINEEIYASKSVYPSENHGVVTTQYKNGYGFAFSSFTPVQYIPATGKVMYAKTANVRVSLKAARNYNSAMLWGTPEIKNAVRRLAQNPEMVDSYQTRGREVNAYDLLIITGTEFVENYNAYREYYNSVGLRNEIVTTADIYSSMEGVDNQEKIRNYIIQEYQNNGIMMAVLGGDVDIVPYRGFYCYVTSGGGNQESNNIPADLYYCGLDGTWNDNGNNRWGEIGEDDLLPEIGMSRMSFNNATELANMINKSMSYQQTPVLGEFQKIILAGEHLYDNPVSNGSDYLELLIGTHDDNGYTTTCYPETYNFTKLYEEEGTWSGTALKQSINAGTGYVHHDGHANTSYVAGWYSISNSDFSNVNGTTHNYTFFHTQGCDCGAFDENCILEKMVTIQNFAVAVIGNSRYGWFNEGQTEGPGAHLEREMTDAQYNDRIGLLGCALSDSKTMTAPWVTAPGQWEEGALRWNFYDIHVLGDGAVSVWLDEPFNATVECPSQLVTGTQSFNVTITDDNGSGQKNFRCLLYKDGEVIAMSTTDNEGAAEITIEGGLQSVGEMKLKVTGVNAWPQELDILAVPNNTPYVVYDSYALSGGMQQIEFNGTYAFDMVLKNVGNINANNVTATLTCDNGHVTINEATVNIDEVVGNQSVTLQNVFSFSVSDSIPNNTKVRFYITCTDGTDTWESYFNANIYAPQFELVDAVLEVTTPVLNPGENGIVHFIMKNNGGATAPSATFVVFNGHPQVIAETTQWTFGNVGAGQEFTADLAFTLGDDAEIGAMYELIYAAYFGHYVLRDSYFLPVGQSTENFESGDFNTFNWISEWRISTENPYEGQYCAKSGSISNNETTSLSINVMVGQNSEVSFYYKVSSEQNYDKLHFMIDGTEKANWSGEIGWTQASYNLSSGTHTLTWQYTKDASVSSGSDCAWIDNVVFPASTVITGINTVDEKQNITIYPNPVSNILYMQLGDNQSDVSIYNNIGQMVRHLKSVSGNVQINVSDLQSGLYFVKVGNVVEKIVKM